MLIVAEIQFSGYCIIDWPDSVDDLTSASTLKLSCFQQSMVNLVCFGV